ncbi:REGULATOR OF VPS4 ACTIVITY IN THE MVB PATHWAY PROTEIN [Salix koriyanagi]|uniref:REGULATOR OF VPS4 ACTIVITY IN THE MVB PATHWAY PROTEIN n=1 Tax=Salix koriyanagi TaxID=2511006 RepID=A0A9Q0Q6N7_9ROSI|nr:REGULATOR OF VPS4 ACTIVITY IN THE MVB PATHWAY PROTEIN [Salix koriyanagi]
MFDGLTKSKFYTKCKTSVKMTKTRLDDLKKKKNSLIKHLKNVMADLIRADRAYDAFCRAEGLLVEQNKFACYNFIELFCGCISSNLSLMNKQKECPEECREAVQSLIYAAARFSEFPELRDLRSAFIGRYGPSLEAFVNEEFAEMLKPGSTTKEIKLQLLHDIGQEFSIEWNTKSLEQKLFTPPPSQQDHHRHEPLPSTYNDVYKLKESKDAEFTNKNSLNDDGEYRWENNSEDASTKRVSHDWGNKVNDRREDTFRKREEMIFKYQGRKNVSDDRYKLRSNSEDEEMFSVSRRDSTDQDTTLASTSSVGSISEDEVDSRKPVSYRFIPPPYRRTAAEKQSKIEEPLKSSDEIAAEEANHPDDSTKPKPRSVRRRPLKPPPGHEDFGGFERPLRPPPGRERAGSIASDESAGIYTGAMKQEEPGRGFRIFQTEDGEEKVVDGFLRHDSKNDSPRDAGKSTRHRNAISELPLPPGRETRPRESGAQIDAATGLGRAVSAHPKLPDYDELAARIADLKGR